MKLDKKSSASPMSTTMSDSLHMLNKYLINDKWNSQKYGTENKGCRLSRKKKNHSTDFLGVIPVTKRAEARSTRCGASLGTEGRVHTHWQWRSRKAGGSLEPHKQHGTENTQVSQYSKWKEKFQFNYFTLFRRPKYADCTHTHTERALESILLSFFAKELYYR